MNKIYRTAWSPARGAWVVAAETARTRAKGGTAPRRRVPVPAYLVASLLPLSGMNSALAVDLHVGTNGGDGFINPGSRGMPGSQNISIDTTVDFVFVGGNGGRGGLIISTGGAGGAGTLNIQSGTAQTSDVSVGGNGGNGWNDPGGAGGAGTLNIQGGTAQMGDVSIGGNGGDGHSGGGPGHGGHGGAGTLDIQGGTVQMGAVSLGGNAGVGHTDLSISAWSGNGGAGTLNIRGGTVQMGAVSLGGNADLGSIVSLGGDGGAGTANLSGGSISVIGNLTINVNGTVNFGWDGSASTAGLGITQSPTALINNGTLNFRQTDSLTLDSSISGAGSLTQNGAGTTILTGNSNTFSGTTLVNAGRLAVNGSIASSAVTVNAGGTLGGSGTVGDTTIASGGRLAPGNSIGTLTVAGNLTLNATSVYEIEFDLAGTASDLTHATGTATLAGTVTVKHIGGNGTYKPFNRYTILTADGGLIGTFDAVSSNYVFLDPSLEYNANNVRLTLLRNNIAFASVAQTANQRATAQGLESLDQGNALYDTIVTLNDAAARHSFDLLSGEVHPSSTAALQSVATLAQRLSFNHLRANLSAPLQAGAPIAQADDAPIPASALPQPDVLPLWVEVVGNWQRLESDGNAASVDQDTGGLFVGGDHRLANGWHAGGAFGYTDSRIRVDDRAAKTDADSYSLALYGGKAFAQQQGTLNVMLGGAYTWHSIDSRRDVSVGGANQHLTADYDAHTTQLFTELGYAFPVTTKNTLEPFAGLAWSQTRTESFDEKGGSAALGARSNNNELTTTTLGLRGKQALKLGAREASLGGTLGWRHAEGDIRARSSFAFDGGERFTVAGVPVARDAALVEIGAQVMLTRNAALGLNYSGQFGAGNRDHSGRVSLRWRF